MSQAVTAAPDYAGQFAAWSRAVPLPASLADLRRDAFNTFEQLGFPTTRLEEWRFTNVALIAEVPFVVPEGDPSLSRESLEELHLPRLGGAELVFVNGRLAPGLSSTTGLPDGVRVVGLAEAITGEVAGRVGQLASVGGQAFTALNTAFLGDGAVVEVDDGVVAETPIHLLFVTSPGAAPVLSQPRVVVSAGANSQVRIVESHAGGGETEYLSNAVTEVWAADNAVVDHYSVVREADNGFHVGQLVAQLGRASNFSSHAITLGGAIVRNEARVVLGGEGEGLVLGLLGAVAHPLLAVLLCAR